MKKVVSFVLCLVINFSLMAPAFAAASEQSEDGRINELINLAGQAARAHDFDLAAKYEDMLREFGVDVLSTEAVLQLQNAMMSGIEPQLDYVQTPGNTDKAHWYRYSKENYSYSGQKFDIVKLTATSWNDESAWLHLDEKYFTNSQEKTFFVSAATNFIKIAISNADRGMAAIVTFSDLFNSIGADIRTYETLKVNPGDITVYYSADIYISFYWVRPHGNGDYAMKLVENEMLLEYSYAGMVHITDKVGKPYHKPVAGADGHTYDFKPKNFANMDQACQAYIDFSTPVQRGVGDVTFTVAETQVVVPDFGLPPYMDLVV